MSTQFPVVKAASTLVVETADLATDVVQGTRYAGKMYKLGMQTAYKAQLADSFDDQTSVNQSQWSDAQKALYANA